MSVILTDGAWGTELQARGLPVGETPDLWNLSAPERVESVARAYVEAGSQIILTNTFRANRIALAACGAAERAREINIAGVQISRRAAGDRARVFASIGPSGEMPIDEGACAAAFAEQAAALVEAGADGLVIETMCDTAEALAALRAAAGRGLPVVVSMVFDTGRARDRTMTGATPERVARELSEAGADVVGANCGTGIEAYVGICRRMRASTDKPLWIKANAGMPELDGDRAVYRTTPGQFAEAAARLADAGADYIGGCCGSSPAFIRALRGVLPCA